MQVVLVGTTTCGKPYGFHRQDNCGLAIFAIEFQGFNAKNSGDYIERHSRRPAVADNPAPCRAATEPVAAGAALSTPTPATARPAPATAQGVRGP